MRTKKIFVSLIATLFLSTALLAQSGTISDIMSKYEIQDLSAATDLSSLGIEDMTLSSLMSDTDFLSSAVSNINSYLPLNVGEGVTAKKVAIGNENVTLDVDYDESQISVKTIKTSPKTFKSAIKSKGKKNTDLSDAKMLLDVLDSVNRGVVFNIHGTKSNVDATVEFTAEEIKEIVDSYKNE